MPTLPQRYPPNPRRMPAAATRWYSGRDTDLARRRLERAVAVLNARLVDKGRARVSQESLRLRALDRYLDDVEKQLQLPPLV